MAILQAIQRIKDNINDLKQNLAKKGINIPADTKLADMSTYVADQTPAILSTYVTIK
jgi:hypothetical protein